LLLDRLRAHLRRQGRRLDRLAAALPGGPEERLAASRADPALLMVDAGLTPDPWQAEFLRSADNAVLMTCARQVGKTSAVAFKALSTLLTRPGSTAVVIAQREDQASELLRKAVHAYYRLGAPVPVRREGITYFELQTRARILALPGKERSVHGFTADLLIVDEAARVPDEVFHAASPQLSVSGGQFVALSTAFVKTGFFYREWEREQDNRAKHRPPEYRLFSITAKECPRHSPEFLAAERRRMGEWWYNAAYLNVFGDDVAAVFRVEDIKRALDPDVLPLFAGPTRSPIPSITAGAVDATVRPLFGG
jgi:hypothetical protein